MHIQEIYLIQQKQYIPNVHRVFFIQTKQSNLDYIIQITLLTTIMCQKNFLLMSVSSVSPLCAADCWFPGCVVVSQHPLLSLLRVHPPPHADQPSHPLWLHGAFPHQPLEDLLLQITFLAAQAAGQSAHLLSRVFLSAFCLI